MRVDHEDVGLALVGTQLIDLMLELGRVGGKEMIGESKALPTRIVPIEAALEVASDRREAALPARPHADRIELQRGHPVGGDELPQLRQMLDERGMVFFV